MSQRSLSYVLSALSLFCCAALRADGPAQQKEEECGRAPRPMRVSARHIESKGIGYNTGYTTLETFLAPSPNLWSVMPFVDLRGHIFDDGRWAANGGIGLRSLLGSRVYGAYTYYDYRGTRHKGDYNQISFGVETLGNVWDVRLNGYIPFGDKKSRGYNLEFSKFAGNNAFLTQKFEYALAGCNGEVGGFVLKRRQGDLYLAAGPYYLKGTLGGGVWGGSTRLRGSFKNWLALEVNYSYDHVFKNIVQGQLSLSYAFGPKRQIKKDSLGHCHTGLYQRMVYPVVKNEIIPVNHKNVESVAINPITGLPYTVWFVDNTSHSAGTFESPFSTLSSAQTVSNAHDVIYVFPGDLTTTGLNTGIVLKDYQKLWGSVVSQTLVTTLGTVEVPATPSTRVFMDVQPNISVAMSPVITNINPTNDVITVANHNEISGFNIVNLTGHGVAASSITDLNVSKCIIHGPSEGPPVYGINLLDVAGTVLIDRNLIYQGVTGVNVTATGIQNATYILSNNDVSVISNVADAEHGNFWVSTYTDCANISTIVSGNDFNCSNAAVTMTFDNTSLQTAHTVSLDSNSVDCDAASVGADMIFALNDYANVNLSLTNNTLNTPYTDAVLITQNGADIHGSTLNLLVENNTFESWNASLAINLYSGAQLTGSIAKNHFLFDEDSGILISATGSSKISDLAMTENNISGVLETYAAGSDAISISTSGNATASLSIVSNNLQAGSYTVNLSTDVNSSMTASILDNTVTHSGIYGLRLVTSGATTGNWTVSGNTFVASGANFGAQNIGAALVTANSGSTTNLSFTNNTSSQIYMEPTSLIGTYQFTNNSGTFDLTAFSGNTGAVTGP